MDTNTNAVEALIARLLALLESESYSRTTLLDMKFVLRALSVYAKARNITEYTPEIGAQFVDYCKNTLHVCDSRVTRADNITGKLNRLLQGLDGRAALLADNSKKYDLSQDFSDALKAFLTHSAENGNRKMTIHGKRLVCGRFLQNIEDMGCNEIRGVTGELVQKAYLKMGFMEYWHRISLLLRFLFDSELLDTDYSKMIQRHRPPLRQPTVYSPEEIKRVEDSCDLTLPAGIRNLAIILLMTRYGIRSCDITALTFDNIDFERNRLSFVQQKTGDLWEAELLPEVKAALQNYIANVRPAAVKYPNVFITLSPPYVPTSNYVVNVMSRTQFRYAGVDTSERKCGGRAFRSSLASNMINDGVSTEIVRKTLGHGTKNALRHYARIDMESMRLCHLTVPKPSGGFAAILSGKGDECLV